MEFGHIFVVGTGRSGTSLLVEILNKHTGICICNETYFMGTLARKGYRHKMREFGDLSNDDNVRKCVEFMYTKAFRGGDHWRWLQKNVGPEVLLQRISGSDRSERAIFALLMEARAKTETVLGEKTPGHIHFVPTFLEWFPKARIIHMIRDPRAVFVSDFHRRWVRPFMNTYFPYKQLRSVKPLYALFVLLRMSLEWFMAANYHFKYKERYPDNYYLLRFEDLVSDPENQIRQLCNFLGVEFQYQMLEQKAINVGTGFTARREKIGFDKQAINRWKEHISLWAQLWFSLWAKKYMKEFDYID